MEVYILDSLFRHDDVVDRFESLIWTERFNKMGDFQLHLHSTRENRNRFLAGTRLMHNESARVMTVKTVEDTTDDDGRALLKVKGYSLERVLEDRLARGTMTDNLTTVPKWVLTGTPAQVARKMFHDICVLGILDPGDIIPFIVESSIFPPDTIGESMTPITHEIDPMSLYQALSDLCDLYGMGFRMVRNPASMQIHFDIYMGSDRTTKQSLLPPVVFSTEMDNLKNTTEFTTIADYKNVAYVMSKVGTQIVYPLDVDPDINGFDRNVLWVKADDIEDPDPVVAAAQMVQRGRAELAKHRRFSGFDGEISRDSAYTYGVTHHLGDLVELQNQNGFATDMQITEQIFVSDKEGDRSYPTLSINQFITPGSWLGWNFNQVWPDLGPTEYWGNQV